MGIGDELSRRGLLAGAAAVAAGLVGCGDDAGEGAGGGGQGAAGSTSGAGDPAGATSSTAGAGAGQGGGGGAGAGGAEAGGGGAGQGGGGGSPACEETKDDIEGPFYADGAPIVDGALPGATELPGVALVLGGQVRSAATCEPLAGATLDIWQADDEGAYDAEGFTLRGRVVTDAEGRYEVQTIVPGHYLNGAQYRPAHIHVKVSAPGHALLTTQLYFPDDPYNAVDPWFDERLLIATDAADDGIVGRFDFVIA